MSPSATALCARRASATTISRGGVQIVNSNGSAVDTNILSGGEIVFNGGIVGSLSLSSGRLIDLAALAFNTSEKVSFTENGAGTEGALTVTSAGQNLAITLLGQYAAAGFHLSKDADGATEITYTPTISSLDLAARHQ